MLDGSSGWLLERKLNEYRYAYGLKKKSIALDIQSKKKAYENVFQKEKKTTLPWFSRHAFE